MSDVVVGARFTISVGGFGALLLALREVGYQLVGPTVRDGAVVTGELQGVDDLPRGWTDVQEAGTYRLARDSSGALFGFAAGPQSFKATFFAPRVTLVKLRRTTEAAAGAGVGAVALIGVRACDLRAVAIQDHVFLGGEYRDPDYARRRAGTFVVAVNCGKASATCFCASMDAGPRVRDAFDLVLTEIVEGGHRFVVEVGGERGAALLARVESAPAAEDDVARADGIVEATAQSMGRRMERAGFKDALYAALESPRWDDVAKRCLSCANCTMVCPTCFCSTVDDVTDLGGETAERVRRWDSCFTLDHSYVHGGPVRGEVKARYRQWLTHKLASWEDQFGVSGCVGCGRCITWCPPGIDLTAEVAALRVEKEVRDGD